MNRTRYTTGFALLLALLAAALGFNLMIGSAEVRFPEICTILLTGERSSTAGRIIWSIRLPRLLAAALLGGGLSVSGFLLQTFFANPIAGPYVLGISSGAKLAVALVMIFALSRGVILGSWGMILAAFCGSLLAMALILVLSGRVKRMSVLVICGVMIGYICSAITDLAVTFANDSDIVNLHNWSMGSFSGTSWGNVATMSVVVLGGLACAVLLSKPMSAYQLGEVYAQNLGVNLRRFRVELILLSSLLSACVTAFAGPISFVGIAVPHLVKSLFRTAKPLVILPACFLGGGVFCLFCDLLARTLFAPTELSISTVTALFGAPIVVWMLLSRQNGKGGAL